MLRELDIIIKAKEMVSKELTGIRRHLGVFYTETVKRFSHLRRAMLSARAALLTIGLAVGARHIFKSFVEAATDFEKWKEAVGRAGEAWKGFQREIMDAGVMTYLMSSLQAVTGQLDDMKGKGEDVGPVVVKSLHAIGMGLAYVVQGIEIAAGGIVKMGEIAAKTANHVTTSNLSVLGLWKNVFDKVADIGLKISKDNSVANRIKQITGRVSDLGSKAKEAEDELKAMLAGINSLDNLRPSEKLKNLLDDIKKKADAAGAGLQTMGKDDALLGPLLKQLKSGNVISGELNHQINQCENSIKKMNDAMGGEKAKKAWGMITMAGKAAYKAVFDAAKRIGDKWLAVRSIIEDVADRVLTGMSDALIDYAEGGLRTVEERWQAVRAILKDVSQIFLRMAISAASSAIGGALTGAAEGGVFNTGGNRAIPFRAMAGGGLTRGPELVLRGEGAKPEAVVPLPDGRNIPVKMQGGQTVINQTIYAMDAKSFRQYAYQNRDILAEAAGQAKRENPRAYR